MKRVLFILPFAVSPAFAVGFWANIGGGLNAGGFSDVCDTSLCISEIPASISPKGFIFGINASAGLSFAPITPIFVGAGFDFYTGRQKYMLKVTFFGNTTEDSIRLDVRRLYIKLPIGYQLSFPMIKIYFGIHPAYAMYSVKDTAENDYTDYKGFAFGGFANAYYFTGPIGFGGGIFVDYAPSLSGKIS